MSVARITQKKNKRLHKFHEHPFFINCKNPCRFRNTVSILPVSLNYFDFGTLTW